MAISGSDILVMDLHIRNFLIWVTDMDIRKVKVPDICFFFLYTVVPMDFVDSHMGISGEIDVWDGLDDVDLEQSISGNGAKNLMTFYDKCITLSEVIMCP